MRAGPVLCATSKGWLCPEHPPRHPLQCAVRRPGNTGAASVRPVALHATRGTELTHIQAPLPLQETPPPGGGSSVPPISGCHVLLGTTWRSGRSGGSTHPPPEPPVLLKCMRGSLEASLSSSVHSRSHSSSVYTSPDWHRGRGVSRWGWPPHPPQPGRPGSHTGPPSSVQAPQNPDQAPLLVATDCPHLLQTIFFRTLNLSFQCCWGSPSSKAHSWVGDVYMRGAWANH